METSHEGADLLGAFEGSYPVNPYSIDDQRPKHVCGDGGGMGGRRAVAVDDFGDLFFRAFRFILCT